VPLTECALLSEVLPLLEPLATGLDHSRLPPGGSMYDPTRTVPAVKADMRGAKRKYL
jgi:hypothetical protein